jgi:uncharacterized protein YlxW (UPF0749 family)
MRAPAAQLALTAVLLLLGFLVVVQLRAQTTGSELDTRSTEELTTLVANLNTRNDQLRSEVARLEARLAGVVADRQTGRSSVDKLSDDVARIRAWAGIDAVVGSGVRVAVDGPLDVEGVSDLINELRNAGAEAIAVEDVRLVPGVAISGEADTLLVGGIPLDDPFEISAIGRSEVLSGSLSRVGGILAQLAATDPDVVITVTPLERMMLPATTRALVPAHGTPTL